MNSGQFAIDLSDLLFCSCYYLRSRSDVVFISAECLSEFHCYDNMHAFVRGVCVSMYVCTITWKLLPISAFCSVVTQIG